MNGPGGYFLQGELQAKMNGTAMPERRIAGRPGNSYQRSALGRQLKAEIQEGAKAAVSHGRSAISGSAGRTDGSGFGVPPSGGPALVPDGRKAGKREREGGRTTVDHR